MSDSSDIKAGGAFVEIGPKLSAAWSKLPGQISEKMKSVGESMAKVGAAAAVMGAAMSAPIYKAIEAYNKYGETIGKLTKRFGISADTANIAEAISTETGAPARMVAKALAELGRGESSAATQWVQSLGIDIAKLSAENRILGVTMSDVATEHAAEFAEGMKRAQKSITGMYQAIGEALFPVMKPLVDRFTDVAIYTRQLVESNPELIQQWAKMAATITTTGVAIAGVGAAFITVSSPALLATAAVASIAASAAAVSDLLGNSDLGFGQMFNAIRLDGVGLGTWMAEAALGIEEMWINVAARVRAAFDETRALIQEASYDPQIKRLHEIEAQANAKGQRGLALNYGMQAYQLEYEAAQIRLESESYRDKLLSDAKADMKAIQEQMATLMKNDDTGKTGTFGFDFDKFKEGFKKTGDALSGPVMDALEKFLQVIPAHEWGAEKGAAEDDDKGPDRKEAVVGTFNAWGAGSLAAHAGDWHIITNTHLQKIAENTSKMAAAYGPAQTHAFDMMKAIPPPMLNAGIYGPPQTREFDNMQAVRPPIGGMGMQMNNNLLGKAVDLLTRIQENTREGGGFAP